METKSTFMLATRITHDTAKLAKQKGFFSGFKLYDSTGKIITTCFIGDEERRMCSAVSQDILRKWLREEKQVDISVRPERVLNTPQAAGYTATIYAATDTKFHWDLGGVHTTYESALELALFEALKMI